MSTSELPVGSVIDVVLKGVKVGSREHDECTQVYDSAGYSHYVYLEEWGAAEVTVVSKPFEAKAGGMYVVDSGCKWFAYADGVYGGLKMVSEKGAIKGQAAFKRYLDDNGYTAKEVKTV